MNMPTMTMAELVAEIETLTPFAEELHPLEAARLLLEHRRIHAFMNCMWYSTSDATLRVKCMAFAQLCVGPINEVPHALTH